MDSKTNVLLLSILATLISLFGLFCAFYYKINEVAGYLYPASLGLTALSALAGLIMAALYIITQPHTSEINYGKRFDELNRKLMMVQTFYSNNETSEGTQAFDFLGKKISEAAVADNQAMSLEALEGEFLHEFHLIDTISNNLDDRASATILKATRELVNCLNERSTAETKIIEANIEEELSIFKDANKS